MALTGLKSQLAASRRGPLLHRLPCRCNLRAAAAPRPLVVASPRPRPGEGLLVGTEARTSATRVASSKNASTSSSPNPSERRRDKLAVFHVLDWVRRVLVVALASATISVGLAMASPSAVSSAPAGGEMLVQEVWEVVDKHFLDAREGGYSRERWSELRDESLEKLRRSSSSGASEEEDFDKARRVVKQMIKKGIPGGDPYTRFLLPKEFNKLAKYDVSGIGINLGTREEYVTRVDSGGTPAFSGDAESSAPGDSVLPSGESFDQFYVLGVVKDSPSEVAGIHQGDRLISIGEERPKGITPLQAAQMIKERRETQKMVRLTFQRSSDGKVVDVSIESPPREKTTLNAALDWANGRVLPPVEYKMRSRDGRMEGYVNLKEFNARSPRDVKTAVTALEAQGADYIVLDLRNNLGGLVPAGVEISRLFLGSEAPIVYTMTKDGGLQDRAPHPAQYQPPLTDKPLVLLVNKSTASASEIVAGALKDNCRAALAGETTFGKGLIQSVYELSDGSGLIVTVGKYVTPCMSDIDRHGIAASFKTIPSLEEQQDYISACKVR